MLAKAIRNRARDRRSTQEFSARIIYVCEKAEVIRVVNLAGDWRDAVWQMQITADLNRRIRSAVYHCVLAWAEGETPSNAEMIDAACRVVYELGGQAHQFVVAVHRDRPHPHVHIVLNRVNPVNGQVLSLSHDFARLEKACRRIESEMGWPADRGRFDCEIIDGDVHLFPKSTMHWQQKTADRAQGIRPDGRSVRGHERRTGLPALRDALPLARLNHIRQNLDDCRDWAAVHATLYAHRLRYILHRGGARIARLAGSWAMAASHLGTEYGLRRMEARLGVFAPAPAQPAMVAARHPRDTGASANPLMAQIRRGLPRVRCLFRAEQRHAVQSRADRQARSHQLAAEHQKVDDLLAGRDDNFAQAIRRAMKSQYRDARAAWRQATPPARPVMDLMPLLEVHLPELMAARRYRHVLRHAGEGYPNEFSQMVMDHTALRQTWGLSLRAAPDDLPEGLAEILTRYPDDIRVGRNGDVLFARRNITGSLTGFDALNLATLAPVLGTAPGQADGLAMLGPRASATVLLVPDTASALIQMAATDAPYPLIIIVDRIPDVVAERHLRRTVGDRACIVAMGQQPESHELRMRLQQIVPHARHCKYAARELLGSFQNAKPQLDRQSDDGPVFE